MPTSRTFPLNLNLKSEQLQICALSFVNLLANLFMGKNVQTKSIFFAAAAESEYVEGKKRVSTDTSKPAD